MRDDHGVNGDAQRIEQMVWLLFLKVYDAKEELWELHNDKYKSIIPEKLRWRNWAVDRKDGKALTGDALLDFVNNKLFPGIKKIGLFRDYVGKQQEMICFEDGNNGFNIFIVYGYHWNTCSLDDYGCK